MSADDIKLLPCPFCGGSAHLEEHPPHQHVIIDMPYHAGSATVECGGCEAGMIAETAGAVADAWNRRAPSPQGDAPFLNDDDLADLRRLGDVFEDGEGWDIPKERMKRLAELGVVRWRGMDRYSITSFGAFLLKDGPAEFHALPLVTSEEFNAAQDAKLRQRLDAARSTPATEKGAEHG